MVSSFQTKVKSVERDLWREYQALETHLEMRIKKMDRLENIVRNSIAAGTTGNGVLTAAEAQGRLARLEEAYRQLKVENHTLRTAAEVRARAAHAAAHSSRGGDRYQQSPSPLPSGGPRDRERMPSDRMSIHSLDPRKGGGSSRPSSIAVPQRSTSSSRRSMINDMDGHTDDGLLPGSSQPPLSRMQSNQSQQSQQQYQPHPQVQSQASYTGPGGGGGGIHQHERGGVAPNQQPGLANTNSGAATPGMYLQTGGQQQGQGGSSSSSDNKWMLRLRDLEYKLKAEREGRILDRNEALKRINTSESENLALRENLEREKRRSKRESAQSSAGGGNGGP